LSNTAAERYQEEVERFEKISNDVTTKERSASEKSALLAHNKHSLSSTRARLDALTGEDGSVTTYQRVVAAIRQYAQGAGIVTEFDEKDPQSVVAFLDERLEEVDEIPDDSVDVARKLIKRLKMMVRDKAALRCFSFNAYI